MNETNEIPVRSQQLPLDDRPYLERFAEMIGGLKALPAIKVTSASIKKAASAVLLDEIAARDAKHPLPEAMRRFYSQANGLTVRWTSKKHDTSGSINILPIEKVYGSWEGVISFADNDRFSRLRPIDFFADEACCALHLDDSPNPSVYYHYCGEELHDLKVDFAGYLELLLKSRGLWYWPMAIVADLTGQEQGVEPAQFRSRMPELFNDYDPRFFLRHDHAGKDAQEKSERERQIEAICRALDTQGATYKHKKTKKGFIELLIADTADNLAKCSAALVSLGKDGDLSGDWGCTCIGDYSFKKSPKL